MRYLEKPNFNCPVCGNARRWGDHTKCSKITQAQNKDRVVRKANKKGMTKTSEAYFSEMLRRIGE